MTPKSWTVLAATAGAALMLAAPAANARTSVYVQIAPTPTYVQPYYGYSQPYVVTQPSYVYTEPSYVYTQPSFVYTQPYYGGHRGYRRDRDHDGVPDRFDRRPNNPYRY